jgi:hypothetical protein
MREAPRLSILTMAHCNLHTIIPHAYRRQLHGKQPEIAVTISSH